MDERRRFISEWLEGDLNVTELCQAFGISRKTGYKWLARFREGGIHELEDRSRAHRSHPSATPPALEARIVQMRHQHPFWGPRKLRSRLERIEPDGAWPTTSTIGSILKRHGLVRPQRRRHRTPIYPGPFAEGLAPNEVWAADFKGWFRTGDGTRVDPLTVSDCASRYLIRCRAVAETNGDNVRAQLTAAFQEFGMPQALRTDNGAPFASVGVGGLSALSVWLIRLGIRPERIRPAHPEENGAHERMHRTLKQETARPPRSTLAGQQAAFAHFQREYNQDRPHEALGMKTPADVYAPSSRTFPRKLPEIEYPAGSTLRLVAGNGCIAFRDRLIWLGKALVGQHVRLEESACGWQVWFAGMHLGQLDLNGKPKVLPMIPV